MPANYTETMDPILSLLRQVNYRLLLLKDPEFLKKDQTYRAHHAPPDLVNPITHPYDLRVLKRSLSNRPPTHMLYAMVVHRTNNTESD